MPVSSPPFLKLIIIDVLFSSHQSFTGSSVKLKPEWTASFFLGIMYFRGFCFNSGCGIFIERQHAVNTCSRTLENAMYARNSFPFKTRVCGHWLISNGMLLYDKVIFSGTCVAWKNRNGISAQQQQLCAFGAAQQFEASDAGKSHVLSFLIRLRRNQKMLEQT